MERLKRRLITAVLPALLVFAPAALAQDEPTAAQAELVERILELRRQIDELMAQLPPHLRAEVAKRLAEEAAPPAPPPAAEAAGEAAPAVFPPPPPAPPAPDVAAAPASPASVPEPAPPPRPRRRIRPSCNTLAAFDTDGDGAVDAGDRYWRYLYLWLDRNRNGRMEKREIVSPFAEKVREIAANLDTFAGARGFLGEIRVGDRVLLDLKGNGFAPERSRDDAVLAVDASALARGTGPRLLTADGVAVEGVAPFARGWRLRAADGTVTLLNCP